MPHNDIINTHDQLVAAGGGTAITRMYTQGRDSRFCGWLIYKVTAEGMRVVTDPKAAWYNYGQRAFHAIESDRGKAALERAKKWLEQYFPPGTKWVRNRQGAYVTEHINRLFPIKRERD